MQASRASRQYLNIRSLDHLALRIGVPLQVLEHLAQHAVWHYSPTQLLPKKSGGKPREIDAPRRKLKHVQRRLNATLLKDLWLPDSIHAYRAGHSIRTAALPHRARPFLWVADIRQFYPSISHEEVYSMFSRLGCTSHVARLLTKLTTYWYRLPQGAPTSPALANLYLRMSGIAARLGGLAARHHLRVTFFGDDILISSECSFRRLIVHLTHVIESCGLRLHPTKTLPMVGLGGKHEAIGVVMNSRGEEIDVTRAYRRRLATLLHIVERHGPDALLRFGITQVNPKTYLEGKIAFAAYINPRKLVYRERLNRGIQGPDGTLSVAQRERSA
jgi:RNA-directed DNA polymerase